MSVRSLSHYMQQLESPRTESTAMEEVKGGKVKEEAGNDALLVNLYVEKLLKIHPAYSHALKHWNLTKRTSM